jgi:hypothetical protein
MFDGYIICKEGSSLWLPLISQEFRFLIHWKGNPQFLSGKFEKKNVYHKLEDGPRSINLAVLSLL